MVASKNPYPLSTERDRAAVLRMMLEFNNSECSTMYLCAHILSCGDPGKAELQRKVVAIIRDSQKCTG